MNTTEPIQITNHIIKTVPLPPGVETLIDYCKDLQFNLFQEETRALLFILVIGYLSIRFINFSMYNDKVKQQVNLDVLYYLVFPIFFEIASLTILYYIGAYLTLSSQSPLPGYRMHFYAFLVFYGMYALYCTLQKWKYYSEISE